MKRLVILLSLVSLACVFLVVAGAPRGASGDAGKRYIIHLKDGGKLHTDNYTVEKGMVKIFLPAGAISLDKRMIKSIEEVQGEEGTTMQKVFVPTPAPKEEKKGAPGQPKVKPGQAQPNEPTDDLGHTEAWWKERAAEWKRRLNDGEKRYRDAKKDWDNYNGILTGMQSLPGASIPTLVQVNRTTTVNGKRVVVTTGTKTVNLPTSAQYDITKYEDLRGAARTKMDAASADIAEAKQMLDETLPDEARRAGAPKGWVRP